MDRLGIDFLTVLGLPPIQHVELAADLGCRHVSLLTGPSPVNPSRSPPFDLIGDAALRRELSRVMRDRDVSIALGEGFLIRPGGDIRDVAAVQFDPLLELGVRRINVVSMDPDLPRTLDECATIAELASAAGFEDIVCEFAPILTLRDLPMALEAVRHVNRPDFRLLIDTMHLGRTGGTAADLAALDPNLIGYVQLSDAPLTPASADYAQEALSDRKTPGEGDLPLAAMLGAMRRDVVVSLEVPQAAKVLQGRTVRETVEPIVTAARALLAAI
jgi:sugar phosphate isomerase/epimerase